jgi:hypothetical protein
MTSRERSPRLPATLRRGCLSGPASHDAPPDRPPGALSVSSISHAASVARYIATSMVLPACSGISHPALPAHLQGDLSGWGAVPRSPTVAQMAQLGKPLNLWSLIASSADQQMRHYQFLSRWGQPHLPRKGQLTAKKGIAQCATYDITRSKPKRRALAVQCTLDEALAWRQPTASPVDVKS